MQPLEIKIHRKSAVLELRYAGEQFNLSAEYLRVHSPSAEVQGHGPGQSVLQTGKKLVSFKDVIPQGHYAVRIEFSDGHDSGIFSWDYLYGLATHQGDYWQTYLDRLSAANASREPAFIALN